MTLIHGDADPRLERAGLTRVPTFGNLREHGEEWLLAVLRRCVAAGWVSFTGGDRPVVVLTEDGRAVMKGERPARLLLPPLERAALGRPRPAPRGEGGKRPPAAVRPAASAESVDEPATTALFEALRRHRLTLARAEGVPPFVIASDRTLRDIAALRPATLDALMDAYGIGRHKAERYGAGILDVRSLAPGGERRP